MQLSCRVNSRASSRPGETARGVLRLSSAAILLSAISVFFVFSLWPTVPLLRRPRAPVSKLSTTLPEGVATRQHAERRAQEPKDGGVGKRLAGGRMHLLREDGPVEVSPQAGGAAPRGGGPRDNVDANTSTPAGNDNSMHAEEVAAVRSRQSRNSFLQVVPPEKEGGNPPPTGSDEAVAIKGISFPFVQPAEQWRVPGQGISLDARGEPKSGTTWLGRMIPQLALELCGNPDNTWCEMGGLVVTPHKPAPFYEFEMLKKGSGKGDSPSPFLHFKGGIKHSIPGMEGYKEISTCRNGGRVHEDAFEDRLPCESDLPPTRARLMACLWDTSEGCLRFMPSMDPGVRRSAVVVRDPRNVVISERNMRVDVYNHRWVADISLDEFVRRRFETIVSWMFQRWMWHTTTVMNASSHVMIYEDLKGSPDGLIDLAAFMGLRCSKESALEVWRSHKSETILRDYADHGLEPETIEMMNATMARLLPEALALRWGITPTDL